MLYKIGSVEVWRILELNAPFMEPSQLYPTAGADVGELIECKAPGSICPKTGKLIIPIQGFLLKTPSHNILVDSCVGNHKTELTITEWHQRSDNRFQSCLTAAGVGFKDIDYVLCTHLHTDHVGWNTQLVDGRWVPTFPNAKYLMPSADEESAREKDSHMFRESVSPVIEAGQAELVQAGHQLGDHVTLISTPGHTPGHVSVLIESNGKQAIVTGDAIHSVAQCWYPDWHFKYDASPITAVKSRKHLLETASETNCVVLGSHFSLPSIGRVSEQGDAFRWDDH